MAVTGREVAKKARVTRATVSLALNGAPRISEKTRNRILKIARELNYHPNASAARLRKQKTMTIGSYISAAQAPVFIQHHTSEMLEAIVEECIGHEYDMLLNIWKPGSIVDYSRPFEQGKIDGAIIVYPGRDNRGIQELERKGYHAALINGISDKLDYVMIENTVSTGKIIDHLVENGRRRIAMLRPAPYSQAGVERFEAYKSTILKHGLEYDENLVVNIEDYGGDYTDGSMSSNAVKSILKYKPDAVFGFCDHIAVGAIAGIRESGLSVPGDIAVAGFDDVPEAVTSNPKLTTIRHPFRTLGAEAARLLFNRLKDPGMEQQKVIVPAGLIVRESTINKQ